MPQFLRIIGTLVSADVLLKTFCVVDHLSHEAEKLADKLENVEQTLKEN